MSTDVEHDDTVRNNPPGTWEIVVRSIGAKPRENDASEHVMNMACKMPDGKPLAKQVVLDRSLARLKKLQWAVRWSCPGLVWEMVGSFLDNRGTFLDYIPQVFVAPAGVNPFPFNWLCGKPQGGDDDFCNG